MQKWGQVLPRTWISRAEGGGPIGRPPRLNVSQSHSAAPSPPGRPAGEREASRMEEVGAGKQGPRPSPKDFPAVQISK